MYFVQVGFEIVDIVVYGQVGVDRAVVTIVLRVLLHPAPDVLRWSVDTGTIGCHADMTHAVMVTTSPHVVLTMAMLTMLIQLGEQGAVQSTIELMCPGLVVVGVVTRLARRRGGGRAGTVTL